MTTTKIAFRQSIIDGSLNWYNYFAKLVFHAIILHSKTAKYHSWHDVNPNHFCFAAPPPPILFLHFNWKEEFQTSPTCSKRLINLLVWSRETGWISPICYLTSWESDLIVWCCRCSLVVSPPTASSSWSSPSSRWISIFAPDLFVPIFYFLFSLPLSNRLDFIAFHSASPEDRRLRPSCQPRCSSDRWLQPFFISKINLEMIKVTGAYFPNKVDISKYQGSVNTAIAFYLTPSARADTPRKSVLFFLDDTRTPFYAACVAIRAAGTSGHTFCRISAILPRRICVRRRST